MASRVARKSGQDGCGRANIIFPLYTQKGAEMAADYGTAAVSNWQGNGLLRFMPPVVAICY